MSFGSAQAPREQAIRFNVELKVGGRAIRPKLGNAWRRHPSVGAIDFDQPELRSNRAAAAVADSARRIQRWPVGQKYPAVAQSRRRIREQVIPFFALPGAVRRIIS